MALYRDCGLGLVSLLQSEVSDDVPRQMLVDFAVSWNRLLLAGLGVHVDVVIAPGAQQHATLLLKTPNQFAPFHAIVTSRILYFSGTSSSAISMKASLMFRSSSSNVLP